MDSFTAYVLEQLAGLEVYERRMFGAYGLYLGEDFFGIVDDGALYLKTDADSREKYDAKAFTPNPGQTLKNYYEVPAHVLEDAEKLQEWAIEASEK